jgi:predicted enzyme related to lactoylglutathione lyase
MSEAFVWFHNCSNKLNESRSFYEKLLGWTASDGPGGIALFTGDAGPFAGLGASDVEVPGWLLFVAVGDVERATPIALWQKT